MSLGGPQQFRRLRGKVQSNAIFHLQTRLFPQLLNMANKLASHPLLSQLLVDPDVEQQLGPVINEPVQPSGALVFTRMSVSSKTTVPPPQSSSTLPSACSLATNELASSAAKAVRICFTCSPNFGPNVFRFGLISYLSSGPWVGSCRLTFFRFNSSEICSAKR